MPCKIEIAGKKRTHHRYQEAQQWNCSGTGQSLWSGYWFDLRVILTRQDLCLLFSEPMCPQRIQWFAMIVKVLTISILLGYYQPIWSIQGSHQRLLTNKKLLWISSPGFKLLIADMGGNAVADQQNQDEENLGSPNGLMPLWLSSFCLGF